MKKLTGLIIFFVSSIAFCGGSGGGGLLESVKESTVTKEAKQVKEVKSGVKEIKAGK